MRLAALVAAILAFIAAGAKAGGERTIYVSDLSSKLSAAQIADALPAIQTAIERDFYPIWLERAKLVLLEPGQSAPDGAWEIDLVDQPDCIGCAGYHSTKNGVPYAIVGTDLGANPWGVFTHELWEMLVDPYVNDDASGAKSVPIGHGVRYIVETADPVEADQFAYWRRSPAGRKIMISDFVTPLWFVPPYRGWFLPGKLDFTGHCSRPLQILDGGYQLEIVNGKVVSLPRKGQS